MRRSAAAIVASVLSLSLCAVAPVQTCDSVLGAPICTAVCTDADPEARERTVIVTLSEDFTGSLLTSSLYNKIADRYSLTTDYSDSSFIIAGLTADDRTAEALTYDLMSIPYVVSVEEDSPLELSAISNDLYSDSQWSLNNSGIYNHIEASTSGNILTTPDIDIDAPEGWALYKTLPRDKVSVTVAVIDTGIDYQHPDLKHSMWINSGEIPGNGIDDDGNGYVDDVYGWDFYNNDSTVCHYDYNAMYDANRSSAADCDDHGTHVAGIIAAEANNSVGIAGVGSCADIRLMSLKIHGGSNRSGNVSDAIKAIRYADRMGAGICNMSWGSYIESTALYTAIERSHMLFVCAAGNSGTDNDERPLFPACFDLDNVISVAHIDANGNLTYDSNYGLNSVDVAVPATDIYSTFVGTYSSLSGSSMATPHVTAIAAVLYSLGKGIYPLEVKELITGTVKPLESLNGFVKNPGIPSLYNALMESETLLFDTKAPAFTINRSFTGDSILLNFDTTDEGGSGAHFMRYFIGPRNASDFANGTAGTVITGNTLALAKSGLYTFYLSDNAGNETIRTTYILDDILPPTITDTDLSVNNKMTVLTISATISDADSGVKVAKILPGRRSISDFLNDGTQLTIRTRNRVSFSVTEEGTYTLYACDRRGNKSIKYVYAYIRHSTGIAIDIGELSLEVSDSYPLITVLTPVQSTDKVSYRSSNAKVATVNIKGVITAVGEGTCTITVTASSGSKTTCTVTVSLPSDDFDAEEEEEEAVAGETTNDLTTGGSDAD